MGELNYVDEITEKAYADVTEWKERQDRCNGFSSNKYRDGSNVLEDNYEAIEIALRGRVIAKIKPLEEKQCPK